MAYCYRKYRRPDAVELPERRWPNRQIAAAPRWCSVDLRDGNQALADPMGQDKKRQLLDILVAVGFREIELGFPSASQTEFDFVRSAGQSGVLPERVTPQVITQARRPLIVRTFQALAGFRRAIVHLYNSTSEVQRRVVFRKSRREIIELAVEGTEWVKLEASKYPGLEVIYQYSPESFTGTELDFALEICEAVIDVYDPSPERKMILNLPSTVEMTTPNVFADRVEWMARHLRRRSDVILSVHPHNDRGTGVATAELAQLAGAERIEGTLLGNGERSGNVDLVTLAMNLYSQGIDPELDLAHLPEIIGTVEQCTGIHVHPRHPWAGELVYTAFSGSHQDAIHKGLREHQSQQSPYWEVPYLPIDPTDIGRHYEEVIRINSQSGKGGMAHVLERDYGYRIPKAMAADFSEVVQEVTDQTGEELAPTAIVQLFRARYFRTNGERRVQAVEIRPGPGDERFVEAEVSIDKCWHKIRGSGGGPIEAFARGLHEVYTGSWDIVYYSEHARSTGAASEAVAYVAVAEHSDEQPVFGVGEDRDVVLASFLALLAALERMAASSSRSLAPRP
jgi:2-isopropylmalate synthase